MRPDRLPRPTQPARHSSNQPGIRTLAWITYGPRQAGTVAVPPALEFWVLVRVGGCSVSMILPVLSGRNSLVQPGGGAGAEVLMLMRFSESPDPPPPDMIPPGSENNIMHSC